MGKKMHPGSGAVIGAQLVILLILTASLCVQSRKAAAENTYAIMEESGGEKKDYIHWVEFTVPAEVMQKAFRLDMGSIQEDVHLNWVELLAYLGAKYGGDFEQFRQADLDAVTEKLKSGMTMEELTKDMKYYAYYREAYGAVLDGMVGYFEQEIKGENRNTCIDEIWEEFPSFSQYEVRSALAKCGLTTKHIESLVRVLSGGEQAKVRLCKLINKSTNVLLLDEPTNHLDVDAKDELKRALQEYRGSILLICHEPEFYQDIVNEVWDCSKWTTKIL